MGGQESNQDGDAMHIPTSVYKRVYDSKTREAREPCQGKFTRLGLHTLPLRG